MRHSFLLRTIHQSILSQYTRYTFVSFRNFIFGHQKVDIRFIHRDYPMSYRPFLEHPTASSKTREA